MSLISLIFSVNQKIRLLISLAYLCIIITLSLMPSRDIPDIAPFSGFDKFVHVCLYMGFAWLLCWSLHTRNQSLFYYWIILLCILWGIIMETFQFYMQLGRAFEWYDVISNTSGALIGVIIYHLLEKKYFNKP